MKRRSAAGAALAAVAVLLAACGGDGGLPLDPGDDDDPPAVEPDTVCTGRYCNRSLLDIYGKHRFYRKILVTGEIPVISSQKVADLALERAAEVVDSMLLGRDDLRNMLIGSDAYVGVMDDTEVTTDIPEHAFLKNDPNTNWDTRARGLGGTPQRPITTVGEENLLCTQGDVYRGESILVHEFAHTIHLIAIVGIRPGFNTTLDSIFQLPRSEGLWTNTYADTNPIEYWAEGVQSWFNTNQRPQAGIHNHVDTRAELEAHDPRLHALIAEYFAAGNWTPRCPGG